MLPVETVLFVQDTSELDFTSHIGLADAGHLGRYTYGFLAHSCLAIIPNGHNPEVLGLANQVVWSRKAWRNRTEKDYDRYKRRTEGDIWAETLEAIGAAPAEKRWVSVGDRGSDIFSYVRRASALDWRVLLRVTQNRPITTAQGQSQRLKEYMRSRPAQTQTTTIIRGRSGQKKHAVVLQVTWQAVTLQPPTKGDEYKETPIPGWCIRCWNDEVKMEWILFSTTEIRSEEDALEQISWYEHRWLIEEYHKCLKTGCAIEKRQLETAKGLLALLGFLSITAVRLLQLRGVARTTPKQNAIEAGIEPLFLKLVATRFKREMHELTLQQFWRGVAMLGGFIGRKSDGEPGWQTLWDGWRRLQDMCFGAEVVMNGV